MTTVPFALSIHSLVGSAGADAGFAALVGLAILVLLYFAQARETASLRQGLENADQWIEALESQVSQLQRAQAPPVAQPVNPPPVLSPVARPRPGQAVGSRPGGAAAPALAPAGGARPAGRVPLVGAPAGMAAPALAAATRLIPLPGGTLAAAPAAQAGQPAETRIESPGVVAATPGQAAGNEAVGAAPLVSAATADGPTDNTILAGTAPATAAALANGRGQTAAAVAAPPPAAPRRPMPASADAVPLLARSGGSRGLPPLRGPARSEPSRARRLVPILIGLGAVVIIVVALLIVTGNGTSSTTVHKASKLSSRTKHGRTPAVIPSSVTVAVLNGTGVTNLAHDVASRLAGDGYKNGAIATAANQTQATTVVAYLPGHQADARAVAAVLDLKKSAVQAVGQQAMGVACPGASSTSSSSCSDDVIVTVGSDLSGLASAQAG